MIYVLKQIVEDGREWASPEFTARELYHVHQAVDAGWIRGQARWAENASDGAFIYGLDERGKPMRRAPYMAK